MVGESVSTLEYFMSGIMYWGIAIFIMFVLTIGLLYFWGFKSALKRDVPEAEVLVNSRRPGHRFPIIDIVDNSARHMFLKGEKVNRKDIKYKDPEFGLKMDARFTEYTPHDRMEDGTPIHFVGTDLHFATDTRGARAVTDLIHIIRKKYPLLKFIRDDIFLLTIITKSGDDLKHDVGIILSEYEAELGYSEEPSIIKQVKGFKKHLKGKKQDDDVLKPELEPELIPTEENLINTITEIKSKLGEWNIKQGTFSIKDGLALLPMGGNSKDMERLETVVRLETVNDMRNEDMKYMVYIIPIVIIVAIMVVAYLIISNA